MKISEVQPFCQQLIEAHPMLAAVQLKTIKDDGTFPYNKLAGYEDQLAKRGLAILVFRIASGSLIDASKAGASNMFLHIAVAIFENTQVNQAAGVNDHTGSNPTGIVAEDALQYVIEALSGQPKGAPPGTAIIPFHDPFENLGTVNGALTIVANFTKQHRI